MQNLEENQLVKINLLNKCKDRHMILCFKVIHVHSAPEIKKWQKSDPVVSFMAN